MTLTLAGRHPELWKAAVDMFGPFNLLTFLERIPETWKPYYEVALGHPEKDHDFLVERSPQTYIDQITCPLLVIQGANDPRVIEPESHDLVEHLKAGGKQVEYLMFAERGPRRAEIRQPHQVLYGYYGVLQEVFAAIDLKRPHHGDTEGTEKNLSTNFALYTNESK